MIIWILWWHAIIQFLVRRFRCLDIHPCDQIHTHSYIYRELKLKPVCEHASSLTEFLHLSSPFKHASAMRQASKPECTKEQALASHGVRGEKQKTERMEGPASKKNKIDGLYSIKVVDGAPLADKGRKMGKGIMARAT